MENVAVWQKIQNAKEKTSQKKVASNKRRDGWSSEDNDSFETETNEKHESQDQERSHSRQKISVGDPWHFDADTEDPYLCLMDPDPTPLFSDFKDAKKSFSFHVFFNSPAGTSLVLKM